METLYVIEQGSYLTRSGDSLNIMKQGTILEQVRSFAGYIQEPEKGYHPMKM